MTGGWSNLTEDVEDEDEDDDDAVADKENEKKSLKEKMQVFFRANKNDKKKTHSPIFFVLC